MFVHSRKHGGEQLIKSAACWTLLLSNILYFSNYSKTGKRKGGLSYVGRDRKRQEKNKRWLKASRVEKRESLFATRFRRLEQKAQDLKGAKEEIGMMGRKGKGSGRT